MPKTNTDQASGLSRETAGFYTPKTLHLLPDSPGVYLMKDRNDGILYVGKAKNLKKRVSSYFQKGRESQQTQKTLQLVEQIHTIDTIITRSETEALILEANLIKHHMPRYNIMFKDNKFYPSIKVTLRDTYPRIVFARERKKDGSKYYGPYPSSRSVRQIIDMVQRLFLLRTCYELPQKECLNYHIHRCSAPCIGKISREEYEQNVAQAMEFLSGNHEELIEQLTAEMKKAAQALLFEKAQSIKEKIEALQIFEESQSVYLDRKTNADILGYHSRMGRCVIVISMIRNGRMLGKQSFSGELPLEEEDTEVVLDFLMNQNQESEIRPDKIYLPDRFEPILESINTFYENSGNPLRAAIAREEKIRSLMRMAEENASLHAMQLENKVDASGALAMLQEKLALDRLPMRIEGFDIANLLGEQSVASMISFYGGKPDKSNYRRLKMRSKTTQDDFAMIHEAVYRRYKRLRDEKQEYPDLILIDGGKGQLHAALDALSELGLSLNIVSLAKKNEEIYTPDEPEPLVLPKNSPALHILQQVRDETHRFANSYYNVLKSKNLFESELDQIPGIGEKRKRIILQKFLRHDIIKKLSTEDLIRAGIPEASAELVLDALKKINTSQSRPGPTQEFK